jgi:hypothetical protein
MTVVADRSAQVKAIAAITNWLEAPDRAVRGAST